MQNFGGQMTYIMGDVQVAHIWSVVLCFEKNAFGLTSDMEFRNFWSLDKIPYQTINFFLQRLYCVKIKINK